MLRPLPVSAPRMYGIVPAEAEKKERGPQPRQVTFIQARSGGGQPNDQAERQRDQGGFIFKGRFVEAIRETVVRWNVLGNL